MVGDQFLFGGLFDVRHTFLRRDASLAGLTDVVFGTVWRAFCFVSAVDNSERVCCERHPLSGNRYQIVFRPGLQIEEETEQ
jgi:hypothetical protein